MDDFHSPFTNFMPSNTEMDDSPKTLIDFISLHNVHSETNENEDNESSSKTLLDFINAHTAQKENEDDAASLSYLTSQHLNLTAAKEKESDKLLSLKITDKDLLENECDTLEEYTRLFLNSKGRNVLHQPKLKPFTYSPKHNSEKRNEETDLDNVHKEMSHCRISESNKSEFRKIDFTAALKSKLRQNLSTSQTRNSNEMKGPLFPDRLREGSIDFSFFDISHLIDKNILYSSSTLSSFGKVVCKKWNHPLLPKKYQKFEKIRPYNITKSFKFDTPSPDDVYLKAKGKKNSVNES